MLQFSVSLKKGLGGWSQRLHFVPLAALGGPAILLSTHLMFPVLETRNLGWLYFNWGCVITVGLSLAGGLAWIAETRNRSRWSEWIYPLLFIGTIVVAIWYRISGSIYWAFERGYFLD